MAFLYNWNGTFLAQPPDLEDAALGAGRIRDLKNAITERMAIDHVFGVGNDDGKHLQVTMAQLSTKPVVGANEGAIYVKDNGGTTVPYYEDDAGVEHLLGIMDLVYPIGSLYINAAVSTNPATLLGFGTWTAFGTGRTMVGIDVSNPIMDTVGETFGVADTVVPSHTHTITDPGHLHTAQGQVAGATYGQDVGLAISSVNTGTSTTGITIDSAGVTPVNQNYQPSIAVYIWKRTA